MAERKDNPKTVLCPTCSGRKVVSFGDMDVKCATCRGKGVVKA